MTMYSGIEEDREGEREREQSKFVYIFNEMFTVHGDCEDGYIYIAVEMRIDRWNRSTVL